MEAGRLTLGDLVYGRERALFAAMVVISVLVYGGLVLLALEDAAAASTVIFYGAILVLAGFVTHALALGRMRGSGVLVTERQFPFLHQMVTAHSQRLELPYSPTVYVLESGGILNAFATKLLGRKFVIVNADVLALALRRGREAVSFVVAHEVGHHWRGHLRWRWLITPARFVPYLGAAYSRACEYTCDRVGAYCAPDGAIDGLLVLAAGGWLHRHVNAQEFAKQVDTDSGFWIRRAELVSSHPRIPKRVAALLALGVRGPVPEPLTASDAGA
jgi:Zn-dependent protease with chaperone function